LAFSDLELNRYRFLQHHSFQHCRLLSACIFTPDNLCIRSRLASFVGRFDFWDLDWDGDLEWGFGTGLREGRVAVFDDTYTHAIVMNWIWICVYMGLS
jgi:hypothetical protein